MANERILVLENHPELREETRRVLVEAGYLAEAAASGEEAVELAQREPFDLLLADVFLTDLTGIQVFQRIRTIRPEIAGMVLTGHSSYELAVDALNAGFVGFLVKPVVPEQLLAAIVNALEQEKLRRENTRLRAIVPLYELTDKFTGNVPLDELLHQLVTTAQNETQAQVVSIMLIDPSGQELTIAAAAGLPSDVIERQKVRVGEGIAGRVAQTGDPLMLAEETLLDPEIRRLMRKPEVLSSLSLPLRVRGQVIGVLNVSRRLGNAAFKAGDLELASVFAGQAAMAIDQARLFDQLKTLNEISQHLASAVDLNEAASVIVDAPAKLVNARETKLRLSEGALQSMLIKSLGAETQTTVLPREKIISEFQAKDGNDWITLPLQHGDKVLGALKVRMPSTNPLTEEQIGALRTLTHTAGAVIESHSLRARELIAFREVDRAMRSDLNLQQLLDRLLNEMVSTCEADGGALFMFDAEDDRVDTWASAQFEGGAELARAVIKEGHVRFFEAADGNFVSAIGAPLAVGNHIEGAAILVRFSATGRFLQRHLDLLATLTSATALAIRNAQLYARSEEAVIVEERTRIAREIHDGLAQDLSYLVMKISAAQKLSAQGKEKDLRKELTEISDQLRRDIRDVRRLIFALRPLDIETEGFLPALQKFVKEYGQANETEVEFSFQGDDSQLTPKLQTALFRLTQETLNNVRKHANAKHVWIDLQLTDQRLATLCVRDDGTGFDLEQALQAARARGSVGLVQMRERAERAGGRFKIETAPGKGTQIQIQLPMQS